MDRKAKSRRVAQAGRTASDPDEKAAPPGRRRATKRPAAQTDESSDDGKAPSGAGGSKKVRLRGRLTEAGEQRDLSSHPLGALLVAAPMVFDFLSTRDARFLRLADKALRALVAGHPWLDALASSAVSSFLGEWRASFPLASAVCLRVPTLSKTQLAQLVGVTRLSVVDFLRSKTKAPKGGAAAAAKDDGAELPLSVVRHLPRLEALRLVGRQPIAVPRAATAWLELGRLRELALSVLRSSLPASFLQGMGALRKLDLRCPAMPEDAEGSPPDSLFSLTIAALAHVPLLVELRLEGLPFEEGGLAPLTLLQVLSLTAVRLGHTKLNCLPRSVHTLVLRDCSRMAMLQDDSMLALSAVRILVFPKPASVSDAALGGLVALEDLDLTGSVDVSNVTLGVLGSRARLRRLVFPSTAGISDEGVRCLAACPLEELGIWGVNHRLMAGSLKGAVGSIDVA